MDNSATLVITPAGLLDLLSQIDELSEYPVGISETIDGQLQLQVGDSIYEINSEDASEIEVDESVVNEISDINEETYEQLDIDEEVSIESGIIKELAKTLLVGGLVRMGAKVLRG